MKIVDFIENHGDLILEANEAIQALLEKSMRAKSNEGEMFSMQYKKLWRVPSNFICAWFVKQFSEQGITIVMMTNLAVAHGSDEVHKHMFYAATCADGKDSLPEE